MFANWNSVHEFENTMFTDLNIVREFGKHSWIENAHEK